MNNNLSRTEKILSCIIRAIKEGDLLSLDKFLFEFIGINRNLLKIYNKNQRLDLNLLKTYKNQIINAIDIDDFYEKKHLLPILIEKYRVLDIKDALELKNQILQRSTFAASCERVDRETIKLKTQFQIGNKKFHEIFYFLPSSDLSLSDPLKVISNFSQKELEREKELRISKFKSMVLVELEYSIRKRQKKLSDFFHKTISEYGFKEARKLAYETKMLIAKGSISEAAKKFSECIYGHNNRLHYWFLDMLEAEEAEHFANLKQGFALDKEQISIDPDTERMLRCRCDEPKFNNNDNKWKKKEFIY